MFSKNKEQEPNKNDTLQCCVVYHQCCDKIKLLPFGPPGSLIGLKLLVIKIHRT